MIRSSLIGVGGLTVGGLLLIMYNSWNIKKSKVVQYSVNDEEYDNDDDEVYSDMYSDDDVMTIFDSKDFEDVEPDVELLKKLNVIVKLDEFDIDDC
jgi:hypothetical protein